MSFLSTLRESTSPDVAVEIASGHVSAARLEMRDGQPIVSAHASQPLPPGALVPSLTTANVHDRAAIEATLGRVLDRVGRPRRIGLVVPDVIAKVSILRFEKVPPRTQDLDQLVRWQVRKTAPFPIEEGQVAYVPGIVAPDGQDFIVSVARRAVIEEYEGLCAAAGAYAGIVDVVTFNVINAVIAGSGGDPSARSGSPRASSWGDWLLVNVAADFASIAIVRGADLIFFRNRGGEGDGTLADLVHQTAMYYEDRLSGGGFSRVILAGGGQSAAEMDEIRRSLAGRLSTGVESLDPRAAAPLMGLLMRGREAAA
jgi:Tfp pilus assembly PilM family ATPase